MKHTLTVSLSLTRAFAVLPLSEDLRRTGPGRRVGRMGDARLSLLQQQLQPEQKQNGDRHPGRRERAGSREVRRADLLYRVLDRRVPPETNTV